MARLRDSFLVCFCGLIMALVCTRASATKTIKLSSGHDMPVVGLGTWQINPDDVDRAVTAALENGYKHIDTAFVYGNEEAIGKSLKKYFDNGGKREDLFITTKLPPFGNRAADIEPILKNSLEKLGLQYIDMYLIHFAVGFKRDPSKLEPAKDKDGNMILDLDTDHLAMWKAMEAQVKAGQAKSIGLSNFNVAQIENIMKNAEIKPSNLQIELQAYNQQKPLRETCAKHNIAVTSYSSLGSPGSDPDRKTNSTLALPRLLDHPVVQKIAKDHNKSTAQVLLRHIVQNGMIVIPKSTNPERIKQNIDIFDFELTADEMKELNGLDRGEEGRIFDFSVFKGVKEHPQYPFGKIN